MRLHKFSPYKLLSLTITVLYYIMQSTSAECADGPSGQTLQEFRNLIDRTTNEGEEDQVNEMLRYIREQDIIEARYSFWIRVAIATCIVGTTIMLFEYGPTIYNGVSELISDMVTRVPYEALNTIPNLARQAIRADMHRLLENPETRDATIRFLRNTILPRHFQA